MEVAQTPPETDGALPPRVLGRYRSDQPGPTVICVGSLHGNEPAGYLALQDVLETFQTVIPSFRGEFICLTGNRAALSSGVRFLDHDLNRLWPLVSLSPGLEAQGENREQAELAHVCREIEAAFERARGPVYLLDLHTTSGPSVPFLLLGDTLANRRFALGFGCPLVLGLEEYVDGTLLAWADEQGCIAVGVEGGQHQDPVARVALVHAVWVALVRSGMVRADATPEARHARAELERLSAGLPPVFEVRHRHQIVGENGFQMHPGWRSFDRVTQGSVVASDRDGGIAFPESGRILMPKYQTQGDDGFFVIRHIAPFWLGVSEWLRRIPADRLARHLPGVRRVPGDQTTVVVDRRIARWFALQLFHLLGYRRIREDGARLRLSRRARVPLRQGGDHRDPPPARVGLPTT